MAPSSTVQTFVGACLALIVAAMTYRYGFVGPALFALVLSAFLAGVASAKKWADLGRPEPRSVDKVSESIDKPGETERDLREIVDRVPAMIATASAEGLHDYANKRALDYTGATLEEMRGVGFLTIIHPEDQERVKAAWLGSVQSSQPMDILHRLRSADGQYAWFHVRVEPSFDATGRLLRWYGVLNNIDDRKKAEDAHRASELMLNQIVEAIPALVWRATPDGKVDFVNVRVLEYTGALPGDMDEAAWLSRVHPDESARAQRSWSESVALREPHDGEYRIRRADDSYRWFQVRGQPLMDASGKVLSWYGLLLDVDERKKAEKWRQEKEVQASRMLESIPAMVWALDRQGQITYLNRRGVNYLASSFGDLEGMKWTSRIHADDFPRAIKTRNRGLASRRGYENVFRYRVASGDFRWMHAMVEPSAGEDGTIDAWYAVFIDIDDRRRAEDALRSSELMLRKLVEAIPALVWRTGPSGEVDFVNHRTLQYTGRSFEEMVNSAWISHVHPDDSVRVLHSWRESLSLGLPHDAEYRFRRVDGSYRWFHARGEPMRNEAGDIVDWYSVLLDIDERKKAEEALHIAQIKLTRSSKIMTVAELSASIAHEINQPLAAVVANGHACHGWLSAAPPNLERARLTVERVIRDGNAAAQVVARIRALFRSSDPIRTDLDFKDVVDQVLMLLNTELDARGVSVVIDASRDQLSVLGDRVQLQQMLVNLIRNAIDAMDVLSLDSKALTVRLRELPGHLLLEVCDVGGGLQDPERLFEPFFTTKEDGMGMGLAICKSIVTAHDGRIWAAPNLPCGTVMSVTLPLSERHASTAPPSGAL